MRLYFITNCYSTQIEGAGLNLRIGYTCMGIAPHHKFWHRTTKELPAWYKLILPLSFAFFYHTAQSNRWMIFKFHLGAIQIWLKTKGESKDETVGFHIAFRGVNKYKMII